MQPTATIGRACRTEKAASAEATLPASRDERPSRMPRQKGVEASSGVRSVTATKLATAPAAAARPNVRTASMRAAASDAKPIAVTRLVRPQAAPTLWIAPEEAASGSMPRRTLRRMSSMKWIESHVPTTSASEGTTLVRMLTGAPQSPRIPIAQTAPTNGGTQATTIERTLRATAAESATASRRPSELKTRMSRRSARDAWSRSAGRPVSSRSSAGVAAAHSAGESSTRWMRSTAGPSSGGLSTPSRRRTSSSEEPPSAESRWPAMSGCFSARARAAASSSASSPSRDRGMTGSSPPAAPWRRTSKIDRTCSTPSMASSDRASRRRSASGRSSKRCFDRVVARTMQSRSGAPKRAAISSIRPKSAEESLSSERRSSSRRSRDSPTTASPVRTTTAVRASRRQPGFPPVRPPGPGAVPPGRRSIPGRPSCRTGRESPRPPASSSRSRAPRQARWIGWFAATAGLPGRLLPRRPNRKVRSSDRNCGLRIAAGGPARAPFRSAIPCSSWDRPGVRQGPFRGFPREPCPP